MFFLDARLYACHPEAPSFGAEGSRFSARTYFQNRHQGGKNGAKQGQTRAFRAVCRAFGSVSHRLLVFSSKFPRPLLLSPLCATLYHDLNRKSFIVKQKLEGTNPAPGLILENTKACG